MAIHHFDPGYPKPTFDKLVGNYPGAEIYPAADFRLEWGPVFHRGRLDGSARVLVIGQDPGQHEAIARRILVGEAGQRVQGLLAKLGIDRSYVMINAFVYSVFGQGGGERHKDDPAIANYRNLWLDALIVGKRIEAVITLGRLAESAFRNWKATPNGKAAKLAFQAIPHPTFPESASAAGTITKAEATRQMLAKWNAALDSLATEIRHPDVGRPVVRYRDAFDKEKDLRPIPEADLPPGLPPWMGALESWARRTGTTVEQKRATITVTVPKRHRP